jgi:hypothetical protein
MKNVLYKYRSSYNNFNGIFLIYFIFVNIYKDGIFIFYHGENMKYDDKY